MLQMEDFALKSLKVTEPKQDDYAPEGICTRRLKGFYNACIKIGNENQEEQLKETLRGLVSYIFFLALVCIIAFANTTIEMFYYNKVMSRLFLESKGQNGRTFRQISKIEDFWQFAKGPLLDGLFWEKWYNEISLKEFNISNYIFYQNKLIGHPELRQQRVASSDCLVSKKIKEFVPTCFPEYSGGSEDHAPFGPGIRDPNASAWNYRTTKENHEFWFWGDVASYSGGGYAMKLPLNRRDAKRKLDELKTREWIRRGARAVFISFTTYNANINLFCVIRLVVEFPATGGAMSSWSFISIRTYVKMTDYSIFLVIVKMIFLLYLAFFIFQEAVQMYFEGVQYFKEFWNVFDNLLIMSCLCSIGFTFYRDTLASKITIEDIQEGKANLNALAFVEEALLNIIAITIFIALIKVFKFISFNKTMAQLSNTLSSCAKDLLGFFIMFFIVFLAFTQLGYLFFGSQSTEFSTFMNSFFTLFRIILGDFNFHQLERANRILGPIFFLLFVFFVFFVLINMFLAIINDTYSEVKSDMSKQPDQIVMYDYLKKNVMALAKRFKGSKDKTDEENMGDKVGYRKQVHVAEWKAELQTKGFSPRDIDSVLIKYGVDRAGYIDSAGQQLLMDDLERLKEAKLQYMEQTEEDDDISFGKEESDEDEFVAKEYLKYQDFVNIFRRVERIESNMKSLYYKTDAVMTLIAQKNKKHKPKA